MGAIFKVQKLKTPMEAIILVVLLAVVGFAVYEFAPGLKGAVSKQLDGLVLNEDYLNNVTPTEKLPLPSNTPSIQANTNYPAVTIAGYAWNGETAIIAANGGKVTTKGSLMEGNNVNLTIVRQDMLNELKNMQLKFVEEYDKGNKYPSSDRAAMGIMIMGDGVPFYVSTMQSTLDEKFGKDKYHVEVVGCVGGMSDGEDKLIGPALWKSNPQTMQGAVISTVLGDGDWVTSLNFAFASNLKVNPDVTTYDATAVNFYPSENDDYINSAKELIKSQLSGFTVELKEVVDGELTGNTVKRKIDGCATWTPGDKMVFDALSGFTDVASTRDFPNQMATTLVVVKEWAAENPKIIEGILNASLTAANQVKQYEEWQRGGADAVAATFGLENGEYWYQMFKGQKAEKDGVQYSMGGTRALNYADVLQYYGEGADGINRYQAVYNQVSTYLTELNPFGFNEAVERVVPYEEAVNLTYLKNIKSKVVTTDVASVDYTAKKTTVLAQGQWHINFNTGSSTIQAVSQHDINSIYNLLTQAEQTKVTIIGHTDNTGQLIKNNQLSEERAHAVAEALLAKGITVKRFQSVEGQGPSKPLESNDTEAGRAKNRRVEIVLLQ